MSVNLTVRYENSYANTYYVLGHLFVVVVSCVWMTALEEQKQKDRGNIKDMFNFLPLFRKSRQNKKV